MTAPNQYDEAIARHYESYRPPLHSILLERYLSTDTKYSWGLDIGSGTGQSTIALSSYCDRVTGLEPSQEMLSRAKDSPGVNYRSYDKKSIEFPDRTFDIITFAGSLFYGKSQHLLDEVTRVGRSNSPVIVYDFEILFDNLDNIQLPTITATDYDHSIDFSGLRNKGLIKIDSFVGTIALQLNAVNLAHLLLSTKELYSHYQDIYKQTDPYETLRIELEGSLNKTTYELSANLYATFYKKDKNTE